MMEQEEKNIELIEAYLNGSLSESELADFEKRRAEDKDFASAVEDYALIMKEINTSQVQGFTQKLKTWEDEIEKDETRVIPLKRIFSIAATVLIMVIAGGYLASRYLSPAQNAEQLFTAYFKPYPDVISQRSNQSGQLQQGMDLYNQGDFINAIPPLQNYLGDHSNQRNVKCYLGISYLASGQIAEAKKVFDELTRHEPDLFTDIAAWNLALIHLRMEERDALRESLEKIVAQPDHLYKTQAESLHSEYF